MGIGCPDGSGWLLLVFPDVGVAVLPDAAATWRSCGVGCAGIRARAILSTSGMPGREGAIICLAAEAEDAVLELVSHPGTTATAASAAALSTAARPIRYRFPTDIAPSWINTHRAQLHIRAYDAMPGDL
jgi:hypothetical protein